MPKMKTKKAAAKRFKVTGSGKILRLKAGGSHYMLKKSKARARRLAQEVEVTGRQKKHVLETCPYVMRKGS
ncbi:MAG TPA: 50S ribosomal protein L35 [Armatimonadetes bacterium]|nr:50S ribosomal protein L35 [Armatimonadota bacterium]